MARVNRILYTWISLGTLATAVCLLVYLVAQQMWRQSANDPQLQLARDAAAALAAGRTADTVVPRDTVDMERSLAPFVIVFDAGGKVVAASGHLRGNVPLIPPGVLQHARDSGEERVTWQPIGGVRIASVVVSYAGATQGFVLAGRSLQETEERVAKFQTLIGLAWLATVIGLLVVVAAGNWILLPA